MKDIVLEGKNYMQELLEHDCVFQLIIDDRTVYIFCKEDDFLEKVQQFIENQRLSEEKQVIVCSRCGFEVFPSELEEYEYQCFYHDEDLYSIETKTIPQDEYIDYLAKHFNYSKEEAIDLMNGYRKYVQENKQDFTMSIVEFSSMQDVMFTQQM